MGTIGVEATERLIAAVGHRRPDLVFIDAPVSGSREPARDGRLLILASGPDGARAPLRSVFDALGQRLAGRLGVPGTALRDALAGGPLASGVAMTKLAKMESGDYSADFSLEWALKDLDLAIAERWRRLVERGDGRLDVSGARLGLDAATPADR